MVQRSLRGGVMFTEIGVDDRTSSLNTMVNRVSETLRSNLTAQQFNQITITFHLYPEEWTHEIPVRQSNPTLYPDLSKRDESRKLFSVLKRVMDVVGSALALVLFSPFFLVIAAVIKLTSPGTGFFPAETGWPAWGLLRIPEVPFDARE